MGKAVIADLRERVGKAEKADQDLDADIMLGVGVLTRVNCLADAPEERPIWEYRDRERNTVGPHHPMVPPLTASIDAALALVERVLPGAVWHVMTDYGDLKRAKIGPKDRPSASVYRDGDLTLFTVEDGETPPLAILAALLSALSEGGPHAG